jgi:hypothetical protein
VKVRGIVLNTERYQEEEAAARFLNYTSHSFDELDAVFRQQEYRSLSNIFWPPVPEDIENYLPTLRKRIFGYLDRLSYERLYVPMAIGWHVDHVLTHLVFQPWADRPELLYYEDAPYNLFPHATKYRLNELGDFLRDDGDRSLVPERSVLEWWQTAMAYADSALIRNLRPKLIRPFASVVVSIFLFRLMSSHRRVATPAKQRRIVELRFGLSDDAFQKKVQAMTLYRSQFREFFQDINECISTHRAYSLRIDARAPTLERYWRFAEQA